VRPSLSWSGASNSEHCVELGQAEEPRGTIMVAGDCDALYGCQKILTSIRGQRKCQGVVWLRHCGLIIDVTHCRTIRLSSGKSKALSVSPYSFRMNVASSVMVGGVGNT